MTNTIIILDFGSQYIQLIARRIREQHVYCELIPWNAPPEKILTLNPKGIVLSGGPDSVYKPGAPQVPEYIFKTGIPILGICYGMQAMVQALGGRVKRASEPEYGFTTLETFSGNPLLPVGEQQVWMSHGDLIESIPPGFRNFSRTNNTPICGMVDPKRNYFGVQFHPEVGHTPGGAKMLRRFVIDICEASPDWTPASIIQKSVNRIREQVGQDRVLAAVSGGVDSSVATALVHKAIGNQLDAVFVDNGLLRQGEPQRVVKTFSQHLGVSFHPINAVETFLENLRGVKDPETKRRLIGERFIRIFEQEAKKLGTPPYLVQGTIYPDVVESSGTGQDQTRRIKSHHNVGGLPEDMEFKLIEPLRDLFKDEVRAVGEALGLPHEMVWRQPFPGPGLAVRCLGEITWERLERLRAADAIFTQALADAGLLHMHPNEPSASPQRGTAQAFAILLPVQAVGVMGDQRTYQDVIALRAVTTEDFMTADWARLPHSLLAQVANQIVNEVEGVNRVVYDITSKPPATIEWE
ncbi:MAG: GMP synthase (glutamine-hydrolyzing) [Chloroflexota bacterium]|nr:MAG: GMP synthase (glutamine-hydrolyzing) [Chloroflexota bacterium]